jgi:hypothetical protein
MHPTVLFVAVVAITAAVVHGRRPADGSPAARFWEEVLPGTPMPEALAELVQKGTPLSYLCLDELFRKKNVFGWKNIRTICVLASFVVD